MTANSKVLIVDDDPRVRETLSAVLKLRGHAPLTAATGKEALGRVEAESPAVALIDLKLEDMSGLELMKEMRSRSLLDTACIIITGYASQESAIEAMNLGAYSYLRKPYDVDQLLLTIRTAIEKQEAEGKLRKSEEKYRSLFEQSRDAIYMSPREGRFIDANQAMLDLFGYTREEMLETDARDIYVEPADKDRFWEEMEQKGSVLDYEVRFRKKDATPMDCLLTATLRRAEDGSILGYQGIIRDISDRKRAEEERAALVKDLKEINRRLELSNRELQDFAYVASHDLREPMRKISSFGALLQNSLEGKLDEDQQENFEFMIDGARRMQTMIDALLGYSRLTTQARPSQKLDLNQVIEDLKGLELAALLEQTGGSVLVPEPLPPVEGDPSQVHQLLQNLVGNGLKFHREGPAPEITIRARQADGNMVRVEVQDNGIGIEEKHHKEVFTMFLRLHSRGNYAGTGIGLATCKKIVTRHGGDIGVESVPGEGSTFWLTLPGGKPPRKQVQKGGS